jgi:osmotically-inducible protein OsmY
VEDHLEVRPPSRTVGTVGSLPSPDPAAAARPTDELIAASVQAKYFVSDAVKRSDIRVSAREGVVTLTGRADTDARRQAEEIARRVEGVTQVVNRIQVR